MKLIFSFSDPVNFPDLRYALGSLFPHRLASSRFRRGRNTFRSITHFYHLKRFFIRTPSGPVGSGPMDTISINIIRIRISKVMALKAITLDKRMTMGPRDGQVLIIPIILLFFRDITSMCYTCLSNRQLNQPAHLCGHYATEFVNNLILSLSWRFVGRSYAEEAS